MVLEDMLDIQLAAGCLISAVSEAGIACLTNSLALLDFTAERCCCWIQTLSLFM